MFRETKTKPQQTTFGIHRYLPTGRHNLLTTPPSFLSNPILYLGVVENCGYVRRRGPVVRLRGQDRRISEALVDRLDRSHAVGGGRHVRGSGAGYVLHLQIRSRMVEQHHHVPVVGGGCTQSWGPSLWFYRMDT